MVMRTLPRRCLESSNSPSLGRLWHSGRLLQSIDGSGPMWTLSTNLEANDSPLSEEWSSRGFVEIRPTRANNRWIQVGAIDATKTYNEAKQRTSDTRECMRTVMNRNVMQDDSHEYR